MADIRQDLDNKLAENDKNWQIEHDSIRSETHILNQHLEEVRSLHLATDKRIVEMDAGNQQLLEKLLGVEKDLDGKLQVVNENANSLVTKVNSLENETKKNNDMEAIVSTNARAIADIKAEVEDAITRLKSL